MMLKMTQLCFKQQNIVKKTTQTVHIVQISHKSDNNYRSALSASTY